MSQKLKIEFLGAAGTVTGSKTLITYNQKKYLFDCGLFQGPKELRQRNWGSFQDLNSIHAVILSHAHIDHSGFLPKLVKDGFSGPIYSTPATAQLCQLLLMDAAYLQEEDAKYANTSGYSHHQPALPLFDKVDVKKALSQFREVDFHHWHELDTGLSFRFSRAGHILGSAVTQFSFKINDQSKILTMTGDLGNGRSCIIEDPEKILETDYLIMESTYGDRRQSRNSPLDELEPIINQVIRRKGTLVIPAFAVGRTQELLYLVNQLETEGRIPKVPVYLDSPMANSATDIYLNFPNELKKNLHGVQLKSRLSTANFKEVHSADDSMLLCMSTQPKIVISASGMLTGGRVMHHLKAKLPDENSAVLFVGFQASGTKGLLLKNGLKDIRIHHQKVAVEAEIFVIDSLSAHADCEDLVHFVSTMTKKPKKIILNHGEANASASLQYLLNYDLQISTDIAREGTEFILD